VLALAVGDHRRQDHQLGVFRQASTASTICDTIARPADFPGGRAVRRADARVQQAQVVVDFGDGADGRTRVVRSGFLLDRDGRRQAFDQVDIGLFHQLQELARVGRQRFHIAALAFGIQRVERQRGFAGAGQAGNHDQLVARQVEIDVFQVVRACAADADLFHGFGL
jgi:hypothetical protein